MHRRHVQRRPGGPVLQIEAEIRHEHDRFHPVGARGIHDEAGVAGLDLPGKGRITPDRLPRGRRITRHARAGDPVDPVQSRTFRPVRDKHSRPGDVVLAHRPPQLVVEHEALPGHPVDPVPAVQSVLEQDFETAVAGFEHAIVQRLSVVRIRAGVEEQSSQCLPLRVRRLVYRALLPLTECAGQRGKPVVAAPEVEGVRVGAALDEEPRGVQR